MPGIFLCTDPVGRSVLGLDNEGAETGRSSKETADEVGVLECWRNTSTSC